jgi:hypothetical protein
MSKHSNNTNLKIIINNNKLNIKILKKKPNRHIFRRIHKQSSKKHLCNFRKCNNNMHCKDCEINN